MKNIIFIIFLMISMLASGQEFSFQMYFEDALGNRDTLTIGYDLKGSRDNINSEFGEENIAHIPFDSVFDVRISNQTDFNATGFVLFHSKTKMIQLDCTQDFHWYQLLPYTNIIIHALHWPVKVSWDSSLFSDDCINGTLFTSWNPSGWWDHGGGYSNFEAIELISDSQINFMPNYPEHWDESTVDYFTHYIDDSGKPISIFYLAFGDSLVISMNIDLLKKYQVSIFPNPTQGKIYLAGDLLNIKHVAVFDLKGRLLNMEFERNYLDTSHFNNGIYLLVIEYYNGDRIISKIAKTNR